ncbi:response regulator [Pseudogemmobacter bohemicus]|uniref:response regulator n=1 Tax=Pseudogemmobacter bohemicus TaxID=2250708 RepID=UPI000DD46F1C|nr:response regulator transcription factor [Pseudogemmobacter bohemicus]
MRILLVEDETSLGEMLTTGLARQGFVVDLAPSLSLAGEAVLSVSYDAIVLDRTLPDGDGLTLLAQIRRQSTHCPVIVLSALGSSDQKIEGLDKGADDYLAKPFATDELLARLRAITRRPALLAEEKITLGTLIFETGNRSALIGDLPLDLPRRELLVLETLILRAGRIVTREALEQAVYGYDDDIASNALDSHISRLRRKLVPAGLEIHTMRGIGYLLRAVE